MIPLDYETPAMGSIYYTKYKDEYVLIKLDCQCSEKIQTKQYLEFPWVCQECFQKKAENTTVYYRYGCTEPKTKWSGGIWVHKELDLPEEIGTAISIPNTTNMVAITSK